MAAMAVRGVEPERLEDLARGPAGQRVEGPRQDIALDPELVGRDRERLAHGIRVHERVVEIEDDVARVSTPG